MLVLSRKKDEKIVIGDDITICVVAIQGDKVRLGIEAPEDVSIYREEVYEAIHRLKENNDVAEETCLNPCLENLNINIEGTVNHTVQNLVEHTKHGCDSGPGTDH